jgi:hypothetical protein
VSQHITKMMPRVRRPEIHPHSPEPPNGGTKECAWSRAHGKASCFGTPRLFGLDNWRECGNLFIYSADNRHQPVATSLLGHKSNQK